MISDIVVTRSGSSNRYGWGFGEQEDHKDPLTGVHFLAEFYENADKGYIGRATTPTLVDIASKKAVSNDYQRLTNYIEVYFYPYQTNDIDLYPVKYRAEIDRFNDWLFPHVNNGRYRMWFATKRAPYEEGYEDFFDSLEKLDKRLETNRFLFGDYITDSDIRLYVTLQRWEGSYPATVGPMKKRITEYTNLFEYLKELYSIPEFKKYAFFDVGLSSRYLEHIGVKIDHDKEWATDHARRALSKHPDELYLRTKKDESYITEISQSVWNSRNPNKRDNFNFDPDYDVTVNTVVL